MQKWAGFAWTSVPVSRGSPFSAIPKCPIYCGAAPIPAAPLYRPSKTKKYNQKFSVGDREERERNLNVFKDQVPVNTECTLAASRLSPSVTVRDPKGVGRANGRIDMSRIGGSTPDREGYAPSHFTSLLQSSSLHGISPGDWVG